MKRINSYILKPPRLHARGGPLKRLFKTPASLRTDCPPGGINAASHCDGICLNTSVWLDGIQILDCGRVVHPELTEIAGRLYKS